MEQLNVKNLKEANEMYEKIQKIDKELEKLNSLALRSINGRLTSMFKIGIVDDAYIEEKAEQFKGVTIALKKGEDPFKAIMETIKETRKTADEIHDMLAIDTTLSETSTIRILSLLIKEKDQEKVDLQRKLINLGYGK